MELAVWAPLIRSSALSIMMDVVLTATFPLELWLSVRRACHNRDVGCLFFHPRPSITALCFGFHLGIEAILLKTGYILK